MGTLVRTMNWYGNLGDELVWKPWWGLWTWGPVNLIRASTPRVFFWLWGKLWWNEVDHVWLILG